MKKKLLLMICILILLFFISIIAESNKYKNDVLLNSIFSIQFDSNCWIIQKIDKEYLTLVSKDITYDTVSFHFKPKKIGQTNIEFYDTNKKGSIIYIINIFEKIPVNPGYANYFNEGAVISNQSNSFSNFDIAFFLFSNGIYQDAINYYITGKENEPEVYQKIGSAKISYYLGICYFNLKQYNIASSYFAISKMSFEEDIKNYSYYYMAKTHIILGNYDLAIDNLFYLIYRLKPEDALFDNSYFLISSIYFVNKDYEHIILLIYPKIELLDKSPYKDYFNYYLAISYYEGRKDFLTAYSFLKKINNINFEYYQKVLDIIKTIETNFIDFH